MRSMAAKHAVDDSQPAVSHARGIGPLGSAARAVVGTALVGSVLWGHARSGVDVWAWVVGLTALPVLTIVLMRWRATRRPERPVWLAGPVGAIATCALFIAMYATTWYAPSIAVLSDAALVFFGTTMLVAAVRGDAGCEVLAISNWVLRRRDQVGCLMFRSIDDLER
jgi:peptidoglycan/LPS O-acetylase OafA/YrhL